MTGESLPVPTDGEPVRYDPETGSFSSPEYPIIPYSPGTADGCDVVSITRRVLDAAADEMGRRIEWLRIDLGTEVGDSGDTELSDEARSALERYRIGLIGPLSSTGTHTTGAALRDALDLTVEYAAISHLRWAPSPVSTSSDIDVVCIRDLTEDIAAGIEFAPGSNEAERMQSLLGSNHGPYWIDDTSVGFSVRPLSRGTTERLVDRAMQYAYDRDRSRVTIAHRSDELPATEGNFLQWAQEYLNEEYSDGIVPADRFQPEETPYPDDELVVGERQASELCRDLIGQPRTCDVIVAPADIGNQLVTIAGAGVGGEGVTPSLLAGEGQIIAGAKPVGAGSDGAVVANPIATLLSACQLIKCVGWEDTVELVQDAIEATLADGIMTRDLAAGAARGETVSATEFADALLAHMRASPGEETGGVRTTVEERSAIKGIITGTYNVLFSDQIGQSDITLNQLRSPDDEANIYLPEVGINFRYWRRWSTERRLEVLLHEFAHVENYDDDHAPSFYDRLVELTEIAEEGEQELSVVFDDAIDFDLVKRLIVESVHEETIEPDIETVEHRVERLCSQFELHDTEHY